eukprot:scaffold15091_cov45-Phaeocystis_antarctica.AAC.1
MDPRAAASRLVAASCSTMPPATSRRGVTAKRESAVCLHTARRTCGKGATHRHRSPANSRRPQCPATVLPRCPRLCQAQAAAAAARLVAALPRARLVEA